MKTMKKPAFQDCRFVLLGMAVLFFGAAGGRLLQGQNPDGFIQSDQWLALGPFSLSGDFNCDAPDDSLLKEHIAPSRIENMVPADGDEIDYDTAEAATISYNGPPGPGENPMWRPFNDGTDIDGDVVPDLFPDDDLDMDQDAVNVGSATDSIVTFFVTYFEYTEDAPIDVDACVNSDDSVQVWLDTDLVLNNNDCRGRDNSCQDLVPVTVSRGLHRIAMAVFEKGGSSGGSFGFKQKDGEPITDTSGDWVFLGTDPGGLVFPEAAFSTDVSSGPEPLTVQLDASASSTPKGTLTRYSWDFGDGEVAEGVKVAHTYKSGSFYAARLTVANSTRGTDTAEQVIAVTLSPQNVAPWASADVGQPVLPGGERRDGKCLAVFAGGSGISGTADQFHFTYFPKNGTDYVLTAQIDEALWKPGEAIAGIMIRESLDPGSRFALAYVKFLTGATGAQYGLLSRKVPGKDSTASRGNAVSFPSKGFLRLERKRNASGNDEITTSTSPDGAAWALQYTTIISGGLSESSLVGLAVASGDADSSRKAARIKFCNMGFEPAGQLFHRGDSDDNGDLQLTDAVRILGFLFLGQAPPTCLEAADADNNGKLELTDAVRILGFLFLGGPAPAPPGSPPGDCGLDPVDTGDLGCESYTHC